jgi:hypothetical protein
MCHWQPKKKLKVYESNRTNFKFVYFVLHLLMDKRKHENTIEREREREKKEIHTMFK